MDGEIYMDWSKAKNILIVAFIITNLFLAYVLIDTKSIDNPTVDNEFITDVRNLLLEKDIKIDSTIPTEIPSLPLLTIEYETYKPVDLASKFLGQYTAENIEGKEYYRNGDETLIISNGNEIIYTDDNNIKKIQSFEKKNLIRIAEDFIRNKGFASDDYKLSDFRENNGVYYIEFNKVIKDMFLEKSYMKFDIDASGIKKFERYWISSAELGDNNIALMSAPRALLKLITMKDAYGKTITDISTCYYLDLQKHMSVGDPKKMKGGKATLAWRVQFSDGTKIFLEDN